ncbi:g8897 [Coccomyxa elongata]
MHAFQSCSLYAQQRPFHPASGIRPLKDVCRRNLDLTRCRATSTDIVRLKESLRELDRQLEKEGPEAEAAAVQLANQLKEDGLLRAYGGVRQVPKRIYSLEELRLNKIEAEKLLSPTDDTLGTVRTILQGGGLLGLAAAYFGLHWEFSQLLGTLAALGFLLTIDQVANGGGLEALFVDTSARFINRSYGERVANHEAGHFLIAYLIGLLPRTYTLSSLDAFRRYGALNVQAGTLFCDSAFQREVASGTLSSISLDRYSCVALAGIATEYIKYGQAEGGLNDIQQLDGFLRALQFTQKKADGQIRWAVLNVTALLRRYSDVHSKLAQAMAAGKSVGDCIALIEGNADPDTGEDDIKI